jgi:hypothetical protein
VTAALRTTGKRWPPHKYGTISPVPDYLATAFGRVLHLGRKAQLREMRLVIRPGEGESAAARIVRLPARVAALEAETTKP